MAGAKVWRTAGISYVQKAYKDKSASYPTLRAACPSGTHVLGGGEATNAGYADVRLHHTFPYDDGDRNKAPDDGWGVKVTNAGSNDLFAYAICSNRKPKYLVKKQAANASDYTNNQVNCPAGTSPTAGGHLGAKALAHGSGWATPSFWTYFIDNSSNEALPLTAYAICVKFPVSEELGTVNAGATSETFAAATCPSDMHVVGGGLSNGAGNNQIGTNSTFPLDGPDDSAAPEDGWGLWVDNMTLDPISNSAHAVCAGSLR
jgi:hypothetical protein